MKKMNILFPIGSAVTLGDICRYGDCRSLGLRSQAKAFSVRQFAGEPIDCFYKIYRSLPCIQFTVTFQSHVCTLTPKPQTLNPSSYVLLNFTKSPTAIASTMAFPVQMVIKPN